ncbi:hypothetical protein CCO03_05770 [Comamonas serinivorans]|uniref:Thioredoxin domain-containing protein n=1 Tax=Comamonas serinivorans TaxID=1082851 RepID=A0A1Y0ELD7_9BURK|nr:hypothetical protein [Comamonas serinivorans]ARU04251.1 hypothetical protein CCO03_05770 [Comamonas serinivorans]
MSGSNSFDRSATAAPDLTLESPLGMTVHGLPGADAVAPPDTHRASGRIKMLLVLLVCATPVIASYFTYYVLRPEGRRNFGELIQPQRALPEGVARTLDGRTVPLSSLAGQWLLVSVGPGACDTACQGNLYLQRQLRESLGREKERMDRVWLVSDDAPVAAALQPALTHATVLRVPQAELTRWLAPAAGHALNEHLYVVDPMGHWMMRFPANMDVESATRAKRDLDRLMRGSSSWDQPGRDSPVAQEK